MFPNDSVGNEKFEFVLNTQQIDELRQFLPKGYSISKIENPNTKYFQISNLKEHLIQKYQNFEERELQIPKGFLFKVYWVFQLLKNEEKFNIFFHRNLLQFKMEEFSENEQLIDLAKIEKRFIFGKYHNFNTIRSDFDYFRESMIEFLDSTAVILILEDLRVYFYTLFENDNFFRNECLRLKNYLDLNFKKIENYQKEMQNNQIKIKNSKKEIQKKDLKEENLNLESQKTKRFSQKQRQDLEKKIRDLPTFDLVNIYEIIKLENSSFDDINLFYCSDEALLKILEYICSRPKAGIKIKEKILKIPKQNKKLKNENEKPAKDNSEKNKRGKKKVKQTSSDNEIFMDQESDKIMDSKNNAAILDNYEESKSSFLDDLSDNDDY